MNAFRWPMFQKYTSCGFAVVMVDGRGSANRGLHFESAMKHKMVNDFCIYCFEYLVN